MPRVSLGAAISAQAESHKEEMERRLNISSRELDIKERELEREHRRQEAEAERKDKVAAHEKEVAAAAAESAANTRRMILELIGKMETTRLGGCIELPGLRPVPMP